MADDFQQILHSLCSILHHFQGFLTAPFISANFPIDYSLAKLPRVWNFDIVTHNMSPALSQPTLAQCFRHIIGYMIVGQVLWVSYSKYDC